MEGLELCSGPEWVSETVRGSRMFRRTGPKRTRQNKGTVDTTFPSHLCLPTPECCRSCTIRGIGHSSAVVSVLTDNRFIKDPYPEFWN